MSKKRKLCSGRKKAGAIIYLNANVDGRTCEERLAEQEACCRKYCARKNLKISRIFRETSESIKVPSQFDELEKFLDECGKEVSVLVVHTLEGIREYELVETEDYASDVQTD